MQRTFFIGALLFLLPHLALAASFANQSLFLSKSSVTEGETVLIHAVVANSDTTNKFVGTLAFSDESGKIGTTPVSLAAGEAGTVSISWKPTAGSHTVSIELTDTSGAMVEQESAAFTINAKAQDTATPDAVTSSQGIQQSIANLSPALASDSKPVFSVIDSARAGTAQALDSGVAWTKQQVTTAGKTGKQIGKNATTSSTVSAGNSIFSTLWLVLATVLLYILSILRYVVGNAGVFYPIFALLFLFLLWKLFRRFRRRPRY